MDVRSVRGDAATDSLFQPLLIGRTQLRNRLAVAPMTRVSATAARPSAWSTITRPEQAVEARVHVLPLEGVDSLLQGLLEDGVIVLRQDEDGLLTLAALGDMLLQASEGLGAQGALHVQIAEQGGQGDDDPNTRAHLEERQLG